MSKLNAEIKKLEEYKEKKNKELEKTKNNINAIEAKIKEKELEKLKASESADFEGVCRINDDIKKLEEEYGFYIDHAKDVRENSYISKEAYEGFLSVIYKENQEQEEDAVKQIFKKFDEIKKIVNERLEYCRKVNAIKTEYQEATGDYFARPGVSSKVAEYFNNRILYGARTQEEFEV